MKLHHKRFKVYVQTEDDVGTRKLVCDTDNPKTYLEAVKTHANHRRRKTSEITNTLIKVAKKEQMLF